ncbi:MAG: hypothetical protein Tsb009_33990 [Planctomycetaceae bacterium]
MKTGWTWFDETTANWTPNEWMMFALVAACGLLLFLLIARLVKSRGDGGSARNDSPGTSNENLPTYVSWDNRRLFAPSEHLQEQHEDPDIPKVEPCEVPTADTSDLVFGQLTPMLAELFPESPKKRETLKRELKSAGYYGPHAWQNLAAIRYVLMMGSILFFGALLILAPRAMEIPILVLLVTFTSAGWAIPRLYVRKKSLERTSSIEHALPDMLDMLNMCVSQGLTVQESLRRISQQLRQVYPYLAKELDIVREQAEVGTLSRALRNFAERIDIPEVQSFTSLLIQTERMGTSVSQALAEYSDNFREAHRQLADQKANNATFKLLFPTVLCLMPAVYLFLLGPAVIELSDFFQGGGREAIDSGRQALERLNNQ